MGLISLEHSKPVYWADFVLHGSAAVALAAVVVVATPRPQIGTTLLMLPLGIALWTLLEYGLHRFVLHGLRPFSDWHARHHERPHALISGPTLLSAALLAGLFAALRGVLPLHLAAALIQGVLLGYLGYGLTHHATHHWRAGTQWLRRRKHGHALHHHALHPGGYGVTTQVWDRLFGTTLTGPGLRLAGRTKAAPRTSPSVPQSPHGFASAQTQAARDSTNGPWTAGHAVPPVCMASQPSERHP